MVYDHVAALDDHPDVRQALDVRQRVPVDDHDVGDLAGFQGAQFVIEIEGPCPSVS